MKNLLLQALGIEKKAPIEVFVRHCHFSEASAHKKRPSYFSRESCHHNLIQTFAGEKKVNITFFLDSFFSMEKEHFIRRQNDFPVIEIKQGNEAASFLQMMDHVLNLSLDPETIIYFLEDDYLHRHGWASILREGLSLPVDYVTLFDHKDKYFFSQYQDLESKLFLTQSCHWRTTPSTTNTYAMKLKTLIRDQEIHREFSRGKAITEDHAKFCKLKEKGATLISCIPGWATHMEPEFASPCIDWENVLNTSLNSRKK